MPIRIIEEASVPNERGGKVRIIERAASPQATPDQMRAFAGRGRKPVSGPMDMLKGGVSGLYGSLASMAPPVFADGPLRAVRQAADLVAAVQDMRAGKRPQLRPTETAAPTGPLAELMIKAAGQDYTPETRGGRWAKTAGSMLPAVAVPGTALQRAINVVAPTIGAEGSAEVVGALGGGENAQEIARMVGGFAGGLAGDLRTVKSPNALPREDALAMRYVDKMAGDAPLDQVRDAPSEMFGAEALGQSGKRALGSLARREGATGEALNAEVSGRQLGRPGRLLDAFASVSGVHPEAASGDLQRLVDAGRVKAAPLYEQAYDSGPLVNSRLEDLARRPSVRDAIKRAYQIAGEEGVDPEQIGLKHLDNPADWENSIPPSASGASAAEKFAKAAPAKASQGKSLAKFIADAGGIKGADHEISVMDGELWHHGKAYQRKLIGNGDSLDGHAMRAWEAGYFPEFTERPTPRDLLDALDAEFRGKPRYTREIDPRHADRIARHDQAAEMVYRGGLSEDVPSPEQYMGRPEPMSEPVSTTVPTARTWDYVKRGLDDVIEGYRDKTTGKLVLDERGRATLRTLNALRDELKAANPAYGRALETSGDYLSSEAAFRDAGKDIFNSNLSERQFAERFAKLSESSREAYKGGIANRFHDLAQNGRLDPKVLKTPRVRVKLQMALGNDEADRLIELAGHEGDMLAFERRYAPGAGSITSEMAAGQAEQDGMAGKGAEIASDIFSKGPRRAIGAQLSAAMEALGPTRGMSVGARDKAGQALMMSPAELAAAIQKYRAGQPKGPPQVKLALDPRLVSLLTGDR